VCNRTVKIDCKGYKFKDIAAGMGHIIALTHDNKIFGQGANVKGQLGKAFKESNDKKYYRGYLKYYKSLLELSYIPCKHKITQINAGQYHSMLLSNEGEVYMLGSKRFRDLTSDLLSREISDCFMPTKIELPKVVEIATGSNHTLFLTGIYFINCLEDNELYGIGANEYGQLDGEIIHYRDVEDVPRKIQVKTEGRIVRIKAGNISSCVFTDKGEVWYWGGFQSDGAGFNLLNTEIEDITKRGEKIIDFDMGYGHDVLLTEVE